MEFDEFCENWGIQLYDLLDELSEFVAEENPLMVGAIIIKLRDYVDLFESEYNNHLKELLGVGL